MGDLHIAGGNTAQPNEGKNVQLTSAAAAKRCPAFELVEDVG